MRIGKVKLVCVGAAAGLWLAGVAEGSAVGISYVSQDRSVSAASSATGFARDGTTGTPVTEQSNHSQQASGFGDFNGLAAANSNVGPGNAQASGSASQQSTLGPTGFSASGAVRADSSIVLGGPVAGSASSVFHITFDVAAASTYDFTASLNGSNDFAEPGNNSVKIELTDSGGKDLFAPVTSVSNFDANGTLAAGVYSLALDISTKSDDEADNFVNYDISLADGPVNTTANPVTPSPVPLPSALTDSLMMLGGLGIVALVRRRKPQWIRGSMM